MDEQTIMGLFLYYADVFLYRPRIFIRPDQVFTMYVPWFFVLILRYQRAFAGPGFVILRVREVWDYKKSEFPVHETIHQIQWMECPLLFIFLYVTEFLIWLCYFFYRYLRYKEQHPFKKAYLFISLEQEAFLFERDNEYIYNRPRLAYFKYFFKKTRFWEADTSVLQEPMVN